MHIFPHLKDGSEGVTGRGIYADGMVEHDGLIEQLLDKLDALGAHFSTQPHHGIDAWLLAQEPRKAPMIIDLRADPFEMAPVESS